MATRERRLAEFNGEGEPPPGMSVEVTIDTGTPVAEGNRRRRVTQR